MLAIKLESKIPKDWVPYRNRWGHWVWSGPGLRIDRNWPGIKPPNKDVVPEFVDGQWVWADGTRAAQQVAKADRGAMCPNCGDAMTFIRACPQCGMHEAPAA